MVFSDFNFKINGATKSFQIAPTDESIVNVLQYLPVEDKNDLIYLTLQNSLENGVYNRVKLDMYFNLYLAYLYTDIEFTQEEKDDPARLYNILESNGIMKAIRNCIDPNELSILNEWLFDTMETKMKYDNTIASVLHSFIDDLPKNAQAAKDIVEQFNPETFQEVLNFARAANGGRPI